MSRRNTQQSYPACYYWGACTLSSLFLFGAEEEIEEEERQRDVLELEVVIDDEDDPYDDGVVRDESVPIDAPLSLQRSVSFLDILRSTDW